MSETPGHTPQREQAFRAFHSDLSKESFLMGEFTDHNEESVKKERLKWHQKEDSCGKIMAGWAQRVKGGGGGPCNELL